MVFSSTAKATEIGRATELGVREFVQKPIDFDEFATVVLAKPIFMRLPCFRADIAFGA